MNIFSKKKDEKRAEGSCCGGGKCSSDSMDYAELAKAGGNAIKVLGSGCTKCNQLEASVKEALSQLNQSTEIDHVTDFSQIASYGVMTTPALVVNGKVVSYGKVLKVNEAVAILKQELSL